MARREDRTLQVTGTFRDRMTSPLGRVRQQVTKTGDAFKQFGRTVTAPLRVPIRALDTMATKIVNARNLLLGFFAVVAARRAFSGLQAVADGLDEIVKTSDRLNVTAESLSAVRFVADLNAISFSDLSSALSIFQRNLEQARRGVALQRDAFRDLGIDVESLARQGRLDLIAVLAEAADGFTTLSSATERSNALLTVFGRAGARLGPLLAGGADAIREAAREAGRLGAVFDRDTLARAAAFNDSLTRFRTSLRSVSETVFLEVAPRLTAIFDLLARAVAANRQGIVEAFNQIGRAVITTVRGMADAFIGFAGLLEDLGVEFIDTRATELRLQRLQAEIRGLTGELEKFDAVRRKARSEAARGDRQGFALEDIREGARREDLVRALESQGLTIEQFQELLIGRDTRRRAVEALRGELSGGIREVLGGARRVLTAELDRLASEAAAGSSVSASASEAGANLGTAFLESFEETVGRVGSGTFDSLSTSSGQLSQLQAALLGLERPTLGVRRALAEVNAEAQRVALGNQLIPFLESGAVRAQDLERLLAQLNAQQARTFAGIERDGQRSLIEFERRLLALGEPSRAVNLQLAELDARSQRLELADAFDRGEISARNLQRGLEQIDETLERTSARVRGDFSEGFVSAADRILEKWTDWTQFGEEAASTLIDGGLTNLSDGLGDYIARVKTGKEALRDFAIDGLRQISRLIAKFITLQAVSALTGTPFGGFFAKGGIALGSVKRTLPVRKYGDGGIARTPQLAIFGEGREPAEAFVPLPDGRRIPVELRGGRGAGSGLTVIVQTIDSRDTARWFLENRGTLLAIQANGLETSVDSRSAVKRAAR